MLDARTRLQHIVRSQSDLEVLSAYAPTRPHTDHLKPLQRHAIDNAAWIYRNDRAAAVVCLHSKAGSSAWMRALMRARGESQWSDRNPHSPPYDGAPNASKLLADSFTPRITMVRNPYSRLLSGYLDKLEPNETKVRRDGGGGAKEQRAWTSRLWDYHTMRPPGFDRKLHNFSDFVRMLASATRQNHLNRHFTLQSTHCHLPWANA